MMTKYKVTNIKNVLVTNNSVVLKNFRPVRETIIKDENFAKYKKVKFLLKYIFPTFNFCKKDRPYIMITSEWSSNYYHWLHEALPRLVVLKKLHPNAILIFPKRYLKIDFMVKSLKALNVDMKNIVTIRGKSHLKVKDLFFIPYSPDLASPLELANIKNMLLSNLNLAGKINFGDKIYISRNSPNSKAARRTVNEDEVVALIKKYDFKSVFMEDYNFEEQVSIASNAKYMIAPHGAGITHAIFMKNNGVILELSNKKRGVTCFEPISEILNLTHIRQDCEPKNRAETDHMGDIIVDIALLEKNIKSMLEL